MPHRHGLSGSPLGSGMPSDVDQGSTPEGSPPPHSDMLGALSRRPCFETRVIPCTTTIDVVEAGLANALVAFIGGGHATAFEPKLGWSSSHPILRRRRLVGVNPSL
jgi:hypothetical protein